MSQRSSKPGLGSEGAATHCAASVAALREPLRALEHVFAAGSA